MSFLEPFNMFLEYFQVKYNFNFEKIGFVSDFETVLVSLYNQDAKMSKRSFSFEIWRLMRS